MDKYLIIDIALISTSGFLWVAYHALLALAIQYRPLYTTQGMNNAVRSQWLHYIMKNTSGNAILAVQTMRNIIMAASFLSTASITIGLAFLNYSLGSTDISKYAYLGSRDPHLNFVKLLLMFVSMVFSFFNFVICIRNLNHSTTLILLPEEARHLVLVTEAEVSPENAAHVFNRAMLHFTLGMRGYYALIPFLFWLFGPVFMFVSSCCILLLLFVLDRASIKRKYPKEASPQSQSQPQQQQSDSDNDHELHSL